VGNRVLRRIFGLKRGEITGGWIKLQNEEHNLYSSTNIFRMNKSRKTRWSEHVARMVEKTKAYNLLVGNPEAKRTIGKPKRRRESSVRK
jgi:hypothetical protein